MLKEVYLIAHSPEPDGSVRSRRDEMVRKFFQV
jgi:hypothetical protein